MRRLIGSRLHLRSALEGYPNIEVVGEAIDGEVGISAAKRLQPTAIIMDVNMSKMDGITATRLIKKESPQIAVIGLSFEVKDYQIYAMAKAGAFITLNKDSAITLLYAAIQKAVATVHPFLVLEESADQQFDENSHERSIHQMPAEVSDQPDYAHLPDPSTPGVPHHSL